MQVTGMLYRSKLLQFVGFPTSEILGPDASEEEIKALIERHGSIGAVPADQEVYFSIFRFDNTSARRP
jgi:hypothetical protein